MFAQTTVTATTGKLDSLGALVEAGMKAGASQLNSVSFTLSDPTAAGNAAIAAAAKNAEGKAATLAVSMNVKLVKSISDTFAPIGTVLQFFFISQRVLGAIQNQAKLGPPSLTLDNLPSFCREFED
jgi:Protein of unknown function (DUF541)